MACRSPDQAFVQGNSGVSFIPFMYLGAKHMVTGYDHLLFLLGVIFLLSGFREVYTYVTLFAVGHSISLIVAVLTGTNVNAFIVDAIIALSVVYKAFDNMDGFQQLVGKHTTPARTLAREPTRCSCDSRERYRALAGADVALARLAPVHPSVQAESGAAL